VSLIFYAAAACFAANFVLGILVQFGVVDSSPFKWLHHALFFAAFVTAGAAALVSLLLRSGVMWPLLGVLVLFLVLPRIRAGTPAHAALASAALILYVTGFALL
jgi:hypothetical protein